jgi:hypothetical protein
LDHGILPLASHSHRLPQRRDGEDPLESDPTLLARLKVEDGERAVGGTGRSGSSRAREALEEASRRSKALPASLAHLTGLYDDDDGDDGNGDDANGDDVHDDGEDDDYGRDGKRPVNGATGGEESDDDHRGYTAVIADSGDGGNPRADPTADADSHEGPKTSRRIAQARQFSRRFEPTDSRDSGTAGPGSGKGDRGGRGGRGGKSGGGGRGGAENGSVRDDRARPGSGARSSAAGSMSTLRTSASAKSSHQSEAAVTDPRQVREAITRARPMSARGARAITDDTGVLFINRESSDKDLGAAERDDTKVSFF